MLFSQRQLPLPEGYVATTSAMGRGAEAAHSGTSQATDSWSALRLATPKERVLRVNSMVQ
jgi:hypothetical protein